VPCGRLIPATLALALGAGSAHAQSSQPAAQPTSALRAADLSGRDFAGVELAGEAVEGALRFQAGLVQLWTEGEATLAQGGRRPPTQRLLLEDDVRIDLGPARFFCHRAVVWLSRRDDGAWQVFLYMADVGEPNAAPVRPGPSRRGESPDEEGALAANRIRTGVTADRLPAHGLIAADSIDLLAITRREGRPDDALVYEGERAMASFLGALVSAGRPAFTPDPQSELAQMVQGTLREQQALGPAERPEPIFARDGVISFSAGHIEATPRDGEQVVILSGGVSALYWDHSRDLTIQMRGERMVLFLEQRERVESLQGVAVGAIRGIYIEGDVLVDSQRGVRNAERYTLRSPRLYYDIARDRALVLESVFWTYDDELDLPLWVRARAIRQESANQFRADRATISNTGFATPHLSVGASSVTIASVPRTEGGQRTLVDARNITLNADGFPIGYVPLYRGDPRAFPLRLLRIESSSATGLAFKTGWDILGMLGVAAPAGVQMVLLVDAYVERGLALGLNAEWDRREGAGSLRAYNVVNDTGKDVLTSGGRREAGGDNRTIFTFEHLARFAERWTVRAEAAWLSDANVVQAYEPFEARRRREYATGVSIDRRETNALAILQARGWLNDFTPNHYLLASQGYTAQKLPEARYIRTGDDLLEDVAPGMLTLFSDVRLSRMELAFDETPVSDIGFDQAGRSQRAFGVAPTDSVGDRLRAEGYGEDTVNRLDAREELSSQLASGPLNITPFAVGRLTVYDDEFDQFSPSEDDSTRVFGALGLRLATGVQRVDNGVDSRVLDLHRMRHIVEPSVTFWTAYSNVDQRDLPVYDEQVESLADGSAVRFGLDQTFQTQRGGPGRRRTVAWLTLDGELVVSNDDAERESPIGRWIEARPEESQLGDFATVRSVWQASEAVALTGESVYDLELSQPAQTAVGATVRHDPAFRTTAEVRYLNALDSTFLGLGADYELSDRYGVGVRTVYDTDQRAFQLVGAEIRRRFPNFILNASVRYNDITRETGVGVSFTPTGFGRADPALRGLGGGSPTQRGL
jgi:hypothetical protein